jgi:hypothetical protein
MAVLKTIITDRGIIFPEQYCRIDEMSATKTHMSYSVGIYLNQQVSDNPPHRIEVFSGSFDLYSPLNVLEQAYTHLKTIWPDAVDA